MALSERVALRTEVRRSRFASWIGDEIVSGCAVRVQRDCYNDCAVFGFPVEASDHLVMLRRIDGLMLDGFEIVRLSDIGALLSHKPDRYAELVIGRGQGGEVDPVPDIDLRNWRTVCRDLSDSRRVAEVYNEHARQVHVGRVLRAGRDVLTMRCIDPVGTWESEHTEVPYEEITRISLPARYGTVLS